MRRIKNRFDQNYKGGFRNIHVNIALKRPGGPANSEFLCELQIQHREMWNAEQETLAHDRYIQFRNGRAE